MTDTWLDLKTAKRVIQAVMCYFILQRRWCVTRRFSDVPMWMVYSRLQVTHRALNISGVRHAKAFASVVGSEQTFEDRKQGFAEVSGICARPDPTGTCRENQ